MQTEDEITTNLVTMGYPSQHVLKSIQLHKKSKFGSKFNLSVLVEIITRLQEKEKKDKLLNNNNNNNNDIFIPHYKSFSSVLSLKIGDLVDYRYDNGRFLLCRIINKFGINNNTKLLLHPCGQPISDNKYDKYCNIYNEYNKLAIAKSISLNKTFSRFSNLKINDYIDINPIYRIGHNGWKNARIIKLDPNSLQIKVVYFLKNDQKNYSYWVHLNNYNEVAEFRSKYNEYEYDDEKQAANKIDDDDKGYMLLKDLLNLREFDCVDIRNEFGLFCRGRIIEIDNDDNSFYIQYFGRNRLFNKWFNYLDQTSLYNFAEINSISLRKSSKYNKLKYLIRNSLCELLPKSQNYHSISVNKGYNGWICAKIFQFDSKSDQIQCLYKYYNDNVYLYWTHVDNVSEIIHIDNSYNINDKINVFNNKLNKWMKAIIINIHINCIKILYDNSNDIDVLHVIFDQNRLIFPKLKKDLKYFNDEIKKNRLKWKLIMVTPTNNNTIYQCFAYYIYGDLNLARNIKKEYKKYLKNNNNNNNDICVVILCKIYCVRIRIFEYNMAQNKLNIVFESGLDDYNLPTMLLSKHLNKYYNIIIDKESIDKIPLYYNKRN